MTEILVQQTDITTLNVDVIVNAANNSLLGGGGVDGAIHRAAGPELTEYCRDIGGCETGEARITPGFNLKAAHIIHTVGPVWHGGHQGEPSQLKECYQSCMHQAEKHQLKSIAFPSISCGVYGYPHDQACKIAVETVCKFLTHTDAIESVIFACFSDEMVDQYQQALAVRRL
ncbi:O-acetyl-ADP-ribose deacetylase [Teredinibacter haidensis]|uniref:O-acetyl-ADP-ribose deacetylase n=1 Tax=Teredinibacter haidensis TaxID=2731755 RepID=UPI0009489FF1|nr:O-acetyl-ADP-ribose deacetylase [Teredinibacter haidensis]